MNKHATLGSGCFWCSEAIFQELKGVDKVVSGYSGGHTENPTYGQMHDMDTGHAECVQISFNPDTISYEKLLEVFYSTHDPTTLNRQGNDIGREYRSVIFYHDDEQKKIAQKVTNSYAGKVWDAPIVTEIAPFTRFYSAENYHQNFFKNNPSQANCQVIINPKLAEFRKKFQSLLK
jgi:peptide-methionine (S)-S-oxide reductase